MERASTERIMGVKLFTSGSSASNTGLFTMIVLLLVTPGKTIYETCSGKTMLKIGGLTCRDQQIILDTHNKLRQSVAQGRVANQPAAANMMELHLVYILHSLQQTSLSTAHVKQEGSPGVRRDPAQFHRVASDAQALGSLYNHVLPTPNCRSFDVMRRRREEPNAIISRFPVGQNIASTWTTRTNTSPAPNFPQQINAWFNEVHQFGFYTTGFTPATGHYTQLVWGDSYLIGCGYSFYYDQDKGYTKLYVCNYGPGGNIIGARPYTVGSAACQPQSSRYYGLCGVRSYTYLDRLCSNDPNTSTAQTTVNPWKTFQNAVIAANIPQHTNNSSWYYYG
uniref:SCP domain-containing protein n=1 Tax=Timema monikensis TaxID=170555 RepID=A0A7R9HUK4_9NEOP|nr:unnamed protein product [Timema monikensis]